MPVLSGLMTRCGDFPPLPLPLPLLGRWPAGQQGMYIRANAGELVQGLIEGPTLGDQLGYFVPEGAVGLQQFLRVCSAEAGGSRHGLRAEVQDLFIKGLEDREMRAVAKRDCIAKDRLLAGEPGSVEAHMLHRQLWRLVKEGRADELGFRSERAGRACLNYILVLLAGEPHLPGDPFNGAPGLEPHVHEREQADAWRAICIQVFPRIVGAERCLQLCNGAGVERARPRHLHARTAGCRPETGPAQLAARKQAVRPALWRVLGP